MSAHEAAIEYFNLDGGGGIYALLTVTLFFFQDGTFSLADLIDAFLENDVLRVLRAYENSVTVDIHCAPEGEWSTARMRKESFSKLCRVRVNPDDCPTPAGNIQDFINYISPFLRPTSLEQLLEPSDVVRLSISSRR